MMTSSIHFRPSCTHKHGCTLHRECLMHTEALHTHQTCENVKKNANSISTPPTHQTFSRVSPAPRNSLRGFLPSSLSCLRCRPHLRNKNLQSLPRAFTTNIEFFLRARLVPTQLDRFRSTDFSFLAIHCLLCWAPEFIPHCCVFSKLIKPSLNHLLLSWHSPFSWVSKSHWSGHQSPPVRLSTPFGDFPLLHVNKFVHLFFCLVYYQLHTPNLQGCQGVSPLPYNCHARSLTYYLRCLPNTSLSIRDRCCPAC